MKIGARIKKAIVSLLNDDSSTYPTTQVAENDIATEAFRYSPYGIASHPPLDSLAIVLQGNCHSGDPIALLCSPTERTKGLKSGEVVYENPVAGTSIFLAEDGAINIQAGQSGVITIDAVGDITITAPNVNIAGNMNVTGTITATVDVVAGPVPKSLATHVHAITSGSSAGSTAPPT